MFECVGLQEKKRTEVRKLICWIVSPNPGVFEGQRKLKSRKKPTDVSRTLEMEWNAKRACDQETSLLPRGMIDCRDRHLRQWKIRINDLIEAVCPSVRPQKLENLKIP